MSADTGLRFERVDAVRMPRIALHIARFIDEQCFGDLPWLHDVEETHRSLFRKEGHCYRLIHTSGEQVGAGAIEVRPGSEAILGFWAVAPSWRRQGWGGAIVRRLEQDAVEAGVPYVLHTPVSKEGESLLMSQGYYPHPNQVTHEAELIKILPFVVPDRMS